MFMNKTFYEMEKIIQHTAAEFGFQAQMFEFEVKTYSGEIIIDIMDSDTGKQHGYFKIGDRIGVQFVPCKSSKMAHFAFKYLNWHGAQVFW